MNSRNKGKRGELEWRDVLRGWGFEDARRGQQFSGSPDSPDVICPGLEHLHFEVKRVEAGNVHHWMDQAVADSRKGQMPVVAHRKNHTGWLVTVRAEDFAKLIRKS